MINNFKIDTDEGVTSNVATLSLRKFAELFFLNLSSSGTYLLMITSLCPSISLFSFASIYGTQLFNIWTISVDGVQIILK